MAHEHSPDPVPRADGFEMTEVNGDEYLTPEERVWPAVPLGQSEHNEFGEIEEVPVLELTLYLAGEAVPDPAELGEGLDALITAVNQLDVAAGGSGYTLGDRWAERSKVVVTLLPVMPDGAADRIAALAPQVAGMTASALSTIPGLQRVAARAA